tara:strand:+ start:1279 stop:2169 length:891 start_codon:yes stop_codon:yes gene_type:complete
MPYFPKSKVNIKEASTGEFIYREGRKPFKGKYLELSNGRYYEGTDVINLGSELVKAKEASSNNIMGNSFDAQKYSLLKKKKKKFLQNTKRIPINKTTPIEEDYNRGYYIRYFARRINQPKGYIEVNFDTVKKLQEKVDYDYNLYEVGSVTWALKNGTRKTNNNNLRLLEQTFPFISSLFPILNEFEIIDGPLTTTGGELYYEDGREYIGLYHVHPEKGPMVGAEHINEPHAFLNYSEELSSLTDNIDRTIPIPPPTPSVEVKQPSQTPLRSMLQDRTTTTRSTPSIRRTPTRRSGY